MANENVLKNDEVKKEEVSLPKTLDELFIGEYYKVQQELAKANETIATYSKVLNALPRPELVVEEGKAKLSFSGLESEISELYVAGVETERFLTITNFFELTEELVRLIQEKPEKPE